MSAVYKAFKIGAETAELRRVLGSHTFSTSKGPLMRTEAAKAAHARIAELGRELLVLLLDEEEAGQ